MCDLHWVPDLGKDPIVAEFIGPIRGRRVRRDGDLVITVLPAYPTPKVVTIGIKRPEPGECPVCDG